MQSGLGRPLALTFPPPRSQSATHSTNPIAFRVIAQAFWMGNQFLGVGIFTERIRNASCIRVASPSGIPQRMVCDKPFASLPPNGAAWECDSFGFLPHIFSVFAAINLSQLSLLGTGIDCFALHISISVLPPAPPYGILSNFILALRYKEEYDERFEPEHLFSLLH